jgi:thiosulfate reductase cytochrome b subunit
MEPPMTAPTIDELPAADERPVTASGHRERHKGRGRVQVYRHTLWVRVGHWVNVVALCTLLFSGLQIFNAHPMLYWGQKGADAEAGPDHPWIAISAVTGPDGKDKGTLRVGSLEFTTTGVLGVSKAPDGSAAYRGFPSWATLPASQDLATGRRFHFFFAWIFVLNGLVYMVYGFISRHFQRDIAPTGPDLRAIGRSIIDHIKLKHPTGEAATRYNVLQKLAYMAVIFLFLPLMVLTGLTMSPGVDSIIPGLLDLFGGRQSARTIHFISAAMIVAFIVIHLIEVVLAGPINEMRSIITGWYAIPPEHKAKTKAPPPTSMPEPAAQEPQA